MLKLHMFLSSGGKKKKEKNRLIWIHASFHAEIITDKHILFFSQCIFFKFTQSVLTCYICIISFHITDTGIPNLFRSVYV